jgi:hypothetical protein
MSPPRWQGASSSVASAALVFCSTLLSVTYLPTNTNTMLAVAPSRPTPWLGSPRIAAHSRPQTAWRPLVVCSSKEGAHNKGESGIHDPIGW